jgi:hypothetical protein
MGQVLLAEQTARVQRQVAIKLIKVGVFDSELSQRFRAERQSLAMMDHQKSQLPFILWRHDLVDPILWPLVSQSEGGSIGLQ